MIENKEFRTFDSCRETVIRKAIRKPGRIASDSLFRDAVEDAALSAYAEVLERTNVSDDDIAEKVKEARQHLTNAESLAKFTENYYTSVINLRRVGQERHSRPTVRIPEQMPEGDFLKLNVEKLLELSRL